MNTATAPQPASRQQKRASLLKHVKNRWQLYLFLLIPVAYIIIFAYVPMAGLQLAFKKFNNKLGIWGSPWVGFDQFAKFFGSYQFPRVMKNTLIISFYSLFAGFPLPIILALMLNTMRSRRYKKFIQTITYIPHFISTVVMVGMLMQFLNPRIGIVAKGIAFLTGTTMENSLMGSPAAFPHLYVWSGIWQGMGWSSIIYMAALAGVDAELHEAAEIDGAGRFKRVLHIDLPTIMPTATIMLIMNAGQIMNVGFEKVFLMQNTMNKSSSEVISTYVYSVGLASATSDFSYATAIGLFNSIVNFFLIVTVNFLSKKLSDQSLF